MASDRKNFTIIANQVDDLGLSLAAFRLYAHYSRRAGGDGTCWETQDNLALHCRMSTKSVIRAKKELISRGLINCENGIFNHHPVHLVKIKDITEVKEIPILDNNRSNLDTDSGNNRSKVDTRIEVKEIPASVYSSHSKNTQGIIPKEENPNILTDINDKNFAKRKYGIS